MSNVPRAALVAAAKDLNKVLDLSPEIDVKLGVAELSSLVAEAASMVRDGDKITPETRATIDALVGGGEEKTPEAEAEKVTAASDDKKTAASKASGKGKTKFVPIDRDSTYGAILAAAMTGETLDGVAKAVDAKPAAVLDALKNGRRNQGIGFSVAEDGAITITLPEGVDAESMWSKKPPKKKAIRDPSVKKPRATGGERKRHGHVQEMYDAARRGVMPKHVTITSATNVGNQRHLDALRDHAKAGKWDAVRAYEVKGSNTYSQLIRRYQELLLIAHEAKTVA